MSAATRSAVRRARSRRASRYAGTAAQDMSMQLIALTATYACGSDSKNRNAGAMRIRYRGPHVWAENGTSRTSKCPEAAKLLASSEWTSSSGTVHGTGIRKAMTNLTAAATTMIPTSQTATGSSRTESMLKARLRRSSDWAGNAISTVSAPCLSMCSVRNPARALLKAR